MSNEQQFDLQGGVVEESKADALEAQRAEALRELTDMIRREPNAARRRQMRKALGGQFGVEWRLNGGRSGGSGSSPSPCSEKTGQKPTLADVLRYARDRRKRR